MKFFENVYDFIAKKWAKIFVLVGFACYGLVLLFSFIGEVSVTKGESTFGSLVSLIFLGVIFAGVVLGYFFKKNRMLLVSFIIFLALIFNNGLVAQTIMVRAVYIDNGVDVANWIFGFLFDLVVAAYIVFLVLIYLFNFKKLEKVAHIVYLAIFPFGLLAWILGIVFAANNGPWYNSIVPLFECAAFLFVPVLVEAGVFNEKKEVEPVEEPKEEKVEEPKEEKVEEPKDEKPEAVEPEVQEDKKEE